MIKQLNIFMENKPGRLGKVTQILTDEKINILAFSVQDRGDYGLMKFLVDNPEKARTLLSNMGYACALKDTVTVYVPTNSGNLTELTAILHKNNINIADVFGCTINNSTHGICWMEIKESLTDNIRKEIETAGFVFAKPADIASLVLNS